MNIRSLKKNDGKELFELMLALDNETQYMLYEPNERKSSSEQMSQKIETINNSKSVIFGAFEGARMVGMIELLRGRTNRIHHCGYIVIGVLSSDSGHGIGAKLLSEVEEWSVHNEITRLELTVMTHNERACELYLRSGYVNEGIKRNSIKIDNQYVDEYYMGKMIG